MPLSVIIIGAGLIGPRHAQTVQAHPDTNLVAFVDPSPSTADIATSFNVPCYASAQSFLDEGARPDIAIVCTPNHTHVPITLHLLESGITNILLEKPVSDSLDSAEHLLQTITKLNQTPSNNPKTKAKINIQIAHHRRFNPFIQLTKSLLDSNSLGSIIAINGLWTLLKPPSYFQGTGSWRADKDRGGVLGINLVHDVDVLQFLFGPITRVFAEGTVSVPQRSEDQNPDLHRDEKEQTGKHTAEEGSALTLRFASGIVGTFLICDITPSPLNFETGTGENPAIPSAPKGASDCYRIFGSRASLSVPDMTRWSYDTTQSEKEKGWNRELSVERIEVDDKEVKPFDAQWGNFVDVVNGKKEVSCGVEDGVRALRVVRAVKEAMEGGRVVDIQHD